MAFSDIEEFLLDIVECDLCASIYYKRLSIQKPLGAIYAGSRNPQYILPFMIPLRDYIRDKIINDSIDVDELYRYIWKNEKLNYVHFAACVRFQRQEKYKAVDSLLFFNLFEAGCKLTDFFVVDLDVLAIMVECYVLDELITLKIDIEDIIQKEQFAYPTNDYKLTRIDDAIFLPDGLIFDGKFYLYNLFTPKKIVRFGDRQPGFITIIKEDNCQGHILYRIDEQLAFPEAEAITYSTLNFDKFFGPDFRFDESVLLSAKTLIVHYDPKTQNKILMVIKKDVDHDRNDQPFWHIEIETLPYAENGHSQNIITTFIHGKYYPEARKFTHVDYIKNCYPRADYLKKYVGCKDGMGGLPVDFYAAKELHYKIWCIEDGEYSVETWYKLVMISLESTYQELVKEILGKE